MYPFSSIETRASEVLTKQKTALMFITVAIFVVFSPTFGNEMMTGWDDQWQVVNEFTTSGLTWSNIKIIFTESFCGQYSPLNQTMYTLIYEIGGYTPVFYHTASLLLHLLNSYMVYLLLRKMLRSLTPLSESRIGWISFLTTLIFAIHPMQVETVAWVSASKILLSTFFYLLATGTFIHFLETRKKRGYALTLLFFVCSYGAKEQAVIFPLWLILLSRLYGRDLLKAYTWMMLLPFFLLAGLFGLVFLLDIFGLHKSLTQDIEQPLHYTWWQRAVFCGYSIFEYVFKWHCPYRLLYLYSYPMEKGQPLPEWMLAYPTILSVTISVFWQQLKKPFVLSGLLFFLIHLILVHHIIPIGRSSIVADRYIYLSSVGITFIGIYLLTGFYPRWNILVRKISASAAVIFLLLLAVYAYNRTLVWHDTATLRMEIKELEKQAQQQTSL